ncbi:TPA: hypothetical protein HA249_06520 [Candidatus Woesearchaeota archaeon]|nr:hypothetical protein [Candidatus Woesearchaeota archaeon]
MTNAKLIKALEKKGFELNFPSYDSNEDLIINILRERDARIDAAIPLCLKEEFNYKEIHHKLTTNKIDEYLIDKFNEYILITREICMLESLPHDHLDRIIKEEKIKKKFDKRNLLYFHDIFQECTKKQEKQKEEKLTKQIELRIKLNMNTALSTIFSPGKIRILEKIADYEPLTMTELQYYYSRIRPLNRAILHPILQNYLRIIESAKKILLKNP